MSILEDQVYAANAAAKAQSHNADLEHRLEVARKSLADASIYDPRVIAFKARRATIAMQTRWWKPSTEPVVPKKRHK
jgi:DNA-directed RNA polymerase